MDDSLDFLTLSERPISSAPSDVVNLSELLQECATSVLNRSLQVTYGSDDGHRKPVTLEMHVAERNQGWFARVPAADLRRCIGNLVANAFAYTDEGVVRVILHSVEEEVKSGKTMIRIEVVDTGRGIPSEFIESGKLFVPFRRGEAFKAGAGLGLPIVMSLVSAHGGRLVLNSTVGKGAFPPFTFSYIRRSHPSPSAGTSVQVFFPLTLVTSERAPAFRRSLSGDIVTLERLATSPDRVLSPVNESPSPVDMLSPPPVSLGSPAQSFTPPQRCSPDQLPLPTAASPPETALSRGRRVKVFVVEDNIVSRNLLGTLIRKKGWDFLSAADGEKGVELFRDSGFRPDLTVMDIGLPKLDGIGASHEIRRIEAEKGWDRHKIVRLVVSFVSLPALIDVNLSFRRSPSLLSRVKKTRRRRWVPTVPVRPPSPPFFSSFL
jgi:CheY-like chemotaxis protein